MRTLWILGLLLLTPLASAHGASAAREFETRLVDDTTGTIEYGGPDQALPVEGLDLLTLDVYEGTMPGTVDPALVFRVTVLGDQPGDHRIDIDLTADAATTLELSTSDLTSYSSTTFELVRGPFDAGSDGHAKTIEGVIRHATLGIRPGDEITDIRVTSYLADAPQDVAPGSWYLAGERVPMPMDEEPPAPRYTTQGPAALFTAVANVSVLPVGEGTVALSFNSTLSSLDQVLTLSAAAPDGINVSLSDTTVLLPAGGSGTAVLSASGVALGSIRVLAQSDLGTAKMVVLALDGAGMIGPGADVDSGSLAAGEAFQYTFTQPGTFEYHCHPHPWMTASITIAQRPNGTAPQTHTVRMVEPSSDTSSWGFDPAALSIHTGDTVIWINEGAGVHTIMGTTGSHGHDDHDHDHDHPAPDKGTPMPFVLAPLGVALYLARRR